jgi:hypothetical protein
MKGGGVSGRDRAAGGCRAVEWRSAETRSGGLYRVPTGL